MDDLPKSTEIPAPNPPNSLTPPINPICSTENPICHIPFSPNHQHANSFTPRTEAVLQSPLPYEPKPPEKEE